ncbi:phosphotransferase [Amaricoccus sp.]|uniref:phosphotransferase n=1 Tax=Amaricoccus sp. TaxID=1872485 RepID=UPI001B744C85|nr:phosphotransferase [Amaricoccus sp.]MBP7000707.1 phosphotransferase [Amaricoccus sp.]
MTGTLTPPRADLDPAPLAALLRDRGMIGAEPLAVTRLTGGQSNPTYRLDAGPRRFVLRKRPPGELLKSAHAIDREYRVIVALRDTDVPVPVAHFYEEDAGIVGTPFYVMDFLDGRVFLDQSLPGVPRADRAPVYREMNRVIAALHAVDPEAVGLGDYGRPGNYFARQIDRWGRQIRDHRPGEARIAALDALADWLPEHVPPGDATALVHGDYRLDNLVFHPTEPRAIGLLDWELSTLGHPLADLSYNCLSWHIPAGVWRGIGGLDLAALGIPDEATYVGWYAGATGAGRIEHWDFYLAYNLYRLAAILQGIARRAREGNAAAPDAVETGEKATPLAELGWQFALRHQASAGG